MGEGYGGGLRNAHTSWPARFRGGGVYGPVRDAKTRR